MNITITRREWIVAKNISTSHNSIMDLHEYEYNFNKIRKMLPSDDSSDKFWYSLCTFIHCIRYVYSVHRLCWNAIKYVWDFSKMYEKIKMSNENIGKVKRQSDGKRSLDKND